MYIIFLYNVKYIYLLFLHTIYVILMCGHYLNINTPTEFIRVACCFLFCRRRLVNGSFK